jgi:hypothetical protein
MHFKLSILFCLVSTSTLCYGQLEVSDSDLPLEYKVTAGTESLPFTINLVNKSSVSTYALDKPTASCGCTAVELTPTIIKPGETGELRAIYKPSSKLNTN